MRRFAFGLGVLGERTNLFTIAPVTKTEGPRSPRPYPSRSAERAPARHHAQPGCGPRAALPLVAASAWHPFPRSITRTPIDPVRVGGCLAVSGETISGSDSEGWTRGVGGALAR